MPTPHVHLRPTMRSLATCSRVPHRGCAALAWAASPLLALTPTAWCGPQSGEEVTVEEGAQGSGNRWSVTVGGGYVHQFTADLDDGGDLSIERGFGVVSGNAEISPSVALGLRASWEGAWYDFDRTSVLTLGTGSQPWRAVQGVQLGGRAQWKVNESWSLSAGLFVGAAGENDADAEDALSFGGTIAAAWRANDRLTLGGGVLAATQIEDDALVIPLLLIDWRITEGLRLSNVAGPEAYPTGAGLELICDALPSWEFGIGGRWEARRFRLDDSGPAPKGVGEDSGLGVWFRAGYRPTERLRIDALVGVMLAEELELEDRDGRSLASDEVDPAPFVGLFASYRF
jgi:hypothetical protein